MQKTNTKISDFIKSLPEQQRTEIQTLHDLIVKTIPKARPVMWEVVFWGGTEQKIIGYGDMNFTNSKNQEVPWFVVGLAQQKNYLTLYVSVFDIKKYLGEDFKTTLGKVKVGRSNITIKNISDINLEKLAEVVKHGYEATKEYQK